MGIKVIDEGDVRVTAGELERYKRDWQKSNSYTTNPSTLEDFIRGQQRAKRDIINAE